MMYPKPEKKKKYTIKKKSAKASKQDRELSEFYRIYDEMWGYVCEGCGGQPVNHSHTLPKGKYKQYATEFRNVHKTCAKCHELIETRQFDGLNCKDKMIEFISEVAPEYMASVNLNRLDQFLIIEPNRVFKTNNINAAHFSANGQNDINIIDLDKNKFLNKDGDFVETIPVVEYLINHLKETKQWDKIKKVKT